MVNNTYSFQKNTENEEWGAKKKGYFFNDKPSI